MPFDTRMQVLIWFEWVEQPVRMLLTCFSRHVYSATLGKEISEFIVIFEANLVMVDVLYKSLRCRLPMRRQWAYVVEHLRVFWIGID